MFDDESRANRAPALGSTTNAVLSFWISQTSVTPLPYSTLHFPSGRLASGLVRGIGPGTGSGSGGVAHPETGEDMTKAPTSKSVNVRTIGFPFVGGVKYTAVSP